MSQKVEGLVSEKQLASYKSHPRYDKLEEWIIDDLNKSGLDPSDIEIIPLKDIDQLWKYLGYTEIKGISIIKTGGYFIKYPLIEYYRLKLKTPIDNAKYLSPKNKGNHAFITPEVAKIACNNKPDQALFFAEGEKKSQKSIKEGFPTIGLAGVWCFKDSESDFIKELENLKLMYRKCYIVFDSDIINKHGVQQAELRLAVELINRGAIPISIRLPSEENGDKNGLDDYLVRYGKLDFQELINKAEPTIELLIKEGTNLNLVLGEIARINSSTEKSKYIKLLADREGVNKREIVKDLKRYEPKSEPRPEKIAYLAVFDGLVDIVDQDGIMLYLVKDGSALLVEESMEIDGITYHPPPREQLPFNCIPRAEEVLRYYKTDSDIELYNDLREYHKSISELPSDIHYDLLTSWDFLTYLYETVQYLPYIWFYAIPERGKSRTGKGSIYVAYRGIHVESLREAYLLRASNDLRATLFFDVMNLSRKAEKAGSDDILLQRFEKGVKVPRVLYPDRGPHKDTVFYDVFGSTIIATNEPVHEILETRAIMISMPESNRSYEKDVKPEGGLPFKERLLAFRARHLGKELPDAQKPSKGRLGDIIKPLLQVIRLANPQREAAFLDLIRNIENDRKEHRSESPEARMLKVIIDLEDRVEDGLLTIKAITDRFNEGEKEKYHTNPKKVGWRVRALGFKKRRLSDGSCLIWDSILLNRLLDRYGMDDEIEKEGQGEIKHHQRQECHSVNNDNGFRDEVSSDVFPSDSKTSQKHHQESPVKQRADAVSDDNDVFSHDTNNNQKETNDWDEKMKRYLEEVGSSS